MKVSVVMSVYNAEKYLRQAVDSILNQTFEDFELIMIDDDSSDCSADILQEYKDQDERVILLKNENNLGLTKSLNRGLAIAKGEYIARMDADDISAPERFTKQVDYLDQHPDYSFVSCIGCYINENGNREQLRLFPEANEEIYAMMPKVDAVMHPGVMFRKDDIEKIGNYCEDFRVVQDYDLWFRGMAAGYKFYNIQEPLVLFRRNESYNTRKSKAYRMIDFAVRKKGYRINHIPLHKRIYIVIPLALAYIPPKVMDKLFYVLKGFDPRNKAKEYYQNGKSGTENK
ncbi:glycosyltransferase [Desulfosporosinus nitroreducens]|uniref:Glycosyltransferase n=1 Tax=Desulfosporosinus nitroreducens TaxID=2018668 RepID=A0ABT8QU90_9FIRM|nr:glycosyltransferase [Desulfosporosinus nitroreducens]MDO0824921.1 glycosyltransferase [Desulfosporosinus nitroreducens]